MFYPLPKKIQVEASQAKWALDTTQSVLAIVGIDELQILPNWQDSTLCVHMTQIVKKAKSLDIPIIHLNHENLMQGMMHLGEQLSTHQQLVIVGFISAQTKQFIDYLGSVTEQICVVNDAIYLMNQEHHIQWISVVSQQHIHHMNSYSLMRLWSLSAPKELVLSTKGILLAIAERLDLEPLEIDPTIDLRLLGLDSVAMVELVALWHANGAQITYENFEHHCSLNQLLQILRS